MPVSMLGKSLKVAVCLSGPKNGRFSRGRCYASLDSRRVRVGFVHEMGVGDDSTRKDLLIYGARSLRSLAPLSRAGLYKTDPDDRPHERSECGENFGDEGVR